ncbi:MAG TPA: MBL fold metallo-hydrolase [Magnetospirillaceae bacterium]|nr:MBL fold metallo-hydrolase [Magnetospirillaceae bacterium]
MRRLILALVALLAGAARADSPFAEAWHDGTGPEPEIQIQRLDQDSYVLRQSIRTNFEGPFLFLFFGKTTALLVDSGAGGLLIRPTIERIMAETGHSALPLVVAHTHGHGDHIAGDGEFAGLSNVVVVGHKPDEVAAFFHIAHWPDQSVEFDLGGRVIDIIPSPGHEAAEIAFFDRKTRILLMGDALYPGRLYVRPDNFDAFKKSVDRVVSATKDRNVAWILGNHIEMTNIAKRDLPMHAIDHPREHRLELPYGALLELQKSLQSMGDRPQLDLHDDFIFYPLP